jgi:hypothetical protein
MQKRYVWIVLLSMLLGGTSCKKFLDAKSVQALAKPSTLGDLEAILNGSWPAVEFLNGMTDEIYFNYEVNSSD